MNPGRLTRRGLLASAGVAVVLPSLAADPQLPKRHYPKNATEALAGLKEGNQRFADGRTLHAHQSADWRKHLVTDQKPFATILGCSDSRVPVELVFDQGFGDLFVVRVAGNVISPDVIGTLAYAVAHLKTPLVLVVGHEGCGAVTAAVQALGGKTEELPGIKGLIELIEPGLPKSLKDAPPENRINVAVEANVRWSIRQLAQLPNAKKAIENGEVSLLGAVYELGTGRVRFLAD